MIIQFTLQSTTDGSFMTGQASNTTVYISKDGGAFVATSNAVSEIGRGLYKVELTAAESAFSTLVYNPVCTGAQNNLYSVDAPTDVSGLATSQDVANIATTANAIKAKTDNLPNDPAAASDIPSNYAKPGDAMTLTAATVTSIKSGLATSQDITNSQAVIIGAMPTTAGLATSADVTAAQAEIIAAMPDISNLATATDLSNAEDTIIGNIVSAMPDISGLSTFDASTDTVTINATQAATMVTADVSELATTADISDAVTDLKNYGQEHWQTANLSELATSSELANTQEDIISAMPDISGLPTAADIWEYTDRTLTEEISVEISSENIADITESVWNADDRTLTDLTPKPNQKNIVCTPTNVLNSYGLRRMENWTNETAGTAAFDTIVNNYIALAKEQMAVDLNNHINAAINYVGADMVTELCAWLTGYKLYSDDESRTTDNLPETRYNMYLEQIHRIMENV